MADHNCPAARLVLFLTGVFLLVISLQTAIFHYRQNFRHWAMYGPVIGAPLMGIFAIMTALFNAHVLRRILGVLFSVGILLGGLGSALHIGGIGQRVGGYDEWQNYLIGPPPALPALISVMSVVGFIAMFWRKTSADG